MTKLNLSRNECNPSSMKARTASYIFAAAALFTYVICLGGCTPKFITYVDGYPSPEELNTAWSLDRSIAVTWFFSRWHPKKIESRGFSEHIEYPEHLSFDTLNILPCDTMYVVINLQIYNPSMKKYRLLKSVTIDGQSREEPIGRWTIREQQRLVAHAPVTPDKEIKFAVKVFSGETERSNEPIISTGELRYIIRSSNPSNPVGKERG